VYIADPHIYVNFIIGQYRMRFHWCGSGLGAAGGFGLGGRDLDQHSLCNQAKQFDIGGALYRAGMYRK